MVSNQKAWLQNLYFDSCYNINIVYSSVTPGDIIHGRKSSKFLHIWKWPYYRVHLITFLGNVVIVEKHFTLHSTVGVEQHNSDPSFLKFYGSMSGIHFFFLFIHQLYEILVIPIHYKTSLSLFLKYNLSIYLMTFSLECSIFKTIISCMLLVITWNMAWKLMWASKTSCFY